MMTKALPKFAGLAAALCLGMALPGTGAHAQDSTQSASNAQKFFQILVSQGSITLGKRTRYTEYAKQGWHCPGRPGVYVCDIDQYDNAKITAVTAPDGCSLLLTVVFNSHEDRVGNYDPKQPIQRIKLDFSKVAGISVAGNSVNLAGTDVAVSAPTADLAGRMGKAFTAIRNTCDPTRGTGF